MEVFLFQFAEPHLNSPPRSRRDVDDRGALLFDYAPLPMSPMTVAGILLLAIVTVAAPLALPAELFGPLCVAPLVLALVYALAQHPSRTRIHARGIAVSLPAWRRWLRQNAFVPWRDVRNAYPAAYEISGASLSPFASSAGTLVHTGLGLELLDGRRIVVKFTPGSIRAFRARTPGFEYAMAAVREAFQALGRPLVTDVRSYADAEVLAMSEEARQPMLGLPTIVFAFFTPPSIAAAVLYGLEYAGVAPGALETLTAVTLAAIPPLASIWYTYGKSRHRNWLLGELAKHEEALRTTSG